jgi:uncharacterized radical SAM protein YgiQ
LDIQLFLPTTKKELKTLDWDACDIILITGDTYVDSPFIGVAVIGKVLLNAGYRVGIIAQPDVYSECDITRLGEPRLFWGVTGGCMDSMVANYTASGKKRKKDDLTAGGINNRRPDRAVIVYANLIRKHFKNTAPIVLGGVEASLRRIAHYDFWTNTIRRSVLFDAKADVLVYGMGEKTVLELAWAIKNRQSYKNLRGLCTISSEKEDAVELPAFEQIKKDHNAFIDMFHTFYRNNDPLTAKSLCQKQDTRYLIQNPSAPYLTQVELDGVYDLEYQRDVHPYYGKDGPVRALETIRFSIASHRGCYGECNFCSISVHEGRTVRWRSEASILREARLLTRIPDFKGIIFDVGGPTANMYGFECEKKLKQGCCPDRRCLYPDICPQLPVDHGRQIALLRKLRKIKGIRQIVVASGIRYDQVLRDEKHGQEYLREVVDHHVSGQLKIAPEHTEIPVLKAMGKSGREDLLTFRERFYRLTKRAGKNQFLTYYFIAAHPGCREIHMKRLKVFTSKELRVHPEQVQIFTPTPSTYSSLTYYTEMDPFTREKVFVEKNRFKKERQKQILISKPGNFYK